MRASGFLSLFISLLTISLHAQTNKEEVLFTIDDEPVYTSEFLRVYNKNLDLVQDESQKNIDAYLELFVNYKLKLKEAHVLGFDKKRNYIRELSNYKKQLAKSFMREPEVTDALVEEAYQRISFDINANHILVKLEETANPQDTLLAYNKINSIRNRALNEGFEKVRQDVHNGQTIYGEKLGYFSGFKMVYNFETAAFNTKVGDISEPFRTRFGYHIVNVIDKRPSRGERTVAHIMLQTKSDNKENLEVKINEIYQKLNQGEDFGALAKQFSEDKSTSKNGGKLSPIVGGQLRSQKFEDVAFGLQNVGDYSKPFKSEYGWHIIKLYNKKPVPEFQTIKAELTQKVERDDRSKLIDAALISKLKVKYNITEKPDLSYFVSILNDSYFNKNWFLPPSFVGKKDLVVIGNRTLSYKNFGNYLVRSQQNVSAKIPFKTIVDNAYNNFLNENILRYHENNLEFENEDFANIVSEYRDGLLLFDLMENTIWNSSLNDTVGIKNYYDKNKSNYFSEEKIDAIVASSSSKKILKQVSKFLKKGSEEAEIKSMVNTENAINILFTSGELRKPHQALPETIEFKEGVSPIYKHNDNYVVVKINKVIPSKQLTLVEAKGLVTSDYQEQKEHNWIKALHNKYQVKINKEALKKVETQLNNN
ncbi:peptidylprolyl isomerase [Neotamlana laminarinivorans]|uniref:Peptidylprolyl isomerase n=1 Tax=Neotamlana laminarinivorans TaxID=2883124 RepID=A0A9X1HZP3_9FLAO|nr:peptidylprolyl isomerase [Tamlana laminarinivorans]MCB4797492.1 peptidylprolyl isomerase [Tamlana laminarinivorans]